MNPTTDSERVTGEADRPRKVRSGLLTALLVWLLVANAAAAVLSPFLLVSIRRQSIPDFPEWAGWAVGALSAACVACVLALFRWRRWGIYGYLLAAAAVFAVNVAAGLGPGPAAIGFVGSAVLLLALQVGGPKRGWSQLE